MAVPSGSTPSTREAANGPAGWRVTRRAAITAAPEQASSGAMAKLGRPASVLSVSHQGLGPGAARGEVTGVAQSGEAADRSPQLMRHAIYLQECTKVDAIRRPGGHQAACAAQMSPTVLALATAGSGRLPRPRWIVAACGLGSSPNLSRPR